MGGFSIALGKVYFIQKQEHRHHAQRIFASIEEFEGLAAKNSCPLKVLASKADQCLPDENVGLIQDFIGKYFLFRLCQSGIGFVKKARDALHTAKQSKVTS